jgi:hypothetical protein
MRGICGLVLCLGLGILLSGSVSAQDAPKPIAIQVVIGADGSVKVIDTRTGKAIDDAVLKLLAKPGAVEVPQLDKKQIDDLRKALDKAIEAEFKAQSEPKREKPAADSVDKKLDLILKQLGELRRDVDQIKSRLDGKRPDGPAWQIVPIPGKDKDKKPGIQFELELVPQDKGKAKKPGIQLEIVPIRDKGQKRDDDPAIQKALDFLRKKQAGESKPGSKIDPDVMKRLEDLIKAIREQEANRPPVPPPPQSDAERIEELQRALERVRRDLEAIRKAKDAPGSPR